MATRFSIIAALTSAILLTPLPAYAAGSDEFLQGIFNGDGPSVDWPAGSTNNPSKLAAGWYFDVDGNLVYDDGSRPGYDTIDPACIGSGNMDCNPDAGFYQCDTADFGEGAGPEPVYCNHNDD
jgi:hypothetical protein